VFYGVYLWIPIILIGAAVYLGDHILNLFMVQTQSRGLVWLAGIMGFLIMVLVGVCYLKQHKKGGKEHPDE